MSGQGKAPRSATRSAATRHVHEVDELIIGAGAHGLQRAIDTVAPSVLLVDEAPAIGGQGAWSEDDPGHVLAQRLPDDVKIWTGALAFGFYDDTVAIHMDGDLHEVRAKTVTLATGRHDPAPLFANNDMPGILSHGAAERLFRAHDVLPGRRIVATPRLRPDLAQQLRQAGAKIVAEGAVTAVDGGTRVKRAEVDGAWLACDTVICDGPGTPRLELAQQAGCALAVRDGVLTVAHEDGVTSRADVRWEGA